MTSLPVRGELRLTVELNTLKLTLLSARLRDNPLKVRGHSLAIFWQLIRRLASQSPLKHTSFGWHLSVQASMRD